MYISKLHTKYYIVYKKYYFCFYQQIITYEKCKKISKIRIKEN